VHSPIFEVPSTQSVLAGAVVVVVSPPPPPQADNNKQHSGINK